MVIQHDLLIGAVPCDSHFEHINEIEPPSRGWRADASIPISFVELAPAYS